MTRKEAFEVSNRNILRFEKTRDLQWKVNITAWSLIVLGITYFGDKDVTINSCLIFWIAVSFLTIHSFYIVFIQRSLAATQRVERYIYEALNNDNTESLIVDVDIKKIVKNVSFHSKDWWWIVLQILTTALLLTVQIGVSLSK
ncbi:MAG: hypothetical protein ABI675_21005 [Chitinophagaceae bacterium]